MKPVVCGCGVHTVPVAGAVSGVTGAVLKTPTRGLPVAFPSDDDTGVEHARRVDELVPAAYEVEPWGGG